jgi:hypothetical protein
MHRLRNVQEARGLTITAHGESVGSIEAFYFDEETWTVRYIVVTRHSQAQQLFVSPVAVKKIDECQREIVLSVTLDQILQSPVLQKGEMITRKYESLYYRYYGWPPYWKGSDRWGIHSFPSDMITVALIEGGVSFLHRIPGEGGLRRIEDILGGSLQTVDGEKLKITDIVFDDETWAMRYFVAEMPGENIDEHLIDFLRATEVDWRENRISVNLSSEMILNAPRYQRSSIITKSIEQQLSDYYGREAEAVNKDSSLIGGTDGTTG